MIIKNDYDVYHLMCECWSGAEDTLRAIMHHDLEDEFMDYFDAIWGDEIPTLTQVNDWLRFDWEDIFNDLGINDDEIEDEDDE